MESLISLPQLLVGLLGISLLYHLYHVIFNYNQRSHKIFAPEAPGALPILGHYRQIHNNKPLRHTLAEMADKHGPVFMIRRGMQNILVVNSWEVAKECYTTNDLAFASRPYSALAKYASYKRALFALSPYGPHWREMRRLTIGELISTRTLEMVKYQRLSEINTFIKELYGLSKDQSTKVEISEMISKLGINILSKTINGRRSYDTFAGTTDEGERLKRVVMEYIDASAITVVSDIIPFPLLEWLDPQGYIRLMKRIGEEFDSILEGWVDEHRKKRLVDGPRSDQDFIDFALSAIENGSVAREHATNTNIKSIFEALLIAGCSTIAVAMVWTISLLLNNEHVLKRAQNELDQKVGKSRWVEECDIKSLAYLQAIIHETLRLYPPGSLGFPHEAREDCCVDGYHIPKGTVLLINMWKVYRDPHVWIDPEKFMPERFLTNLETCNAGKYHFQLFPFGLGRRSCPGMPLALQVIHLVTARLIQGFNLSTPMGMPVDMSEKPSGIMFKALPVEVTITPRLDPKLYQEI
ncbi:hypothetical protein Ancab_040229 [Ancistrocladus abbreviatus]